MFENRNKYKLVMVIIVLIATGFLATSLTSYFVARESLRAEIARNELPLTSDNIYSEIRHDLSRPVFLSALMASDTFLRDWVMAGEIDERHIIKYLKEIQTTHQTFTSFFVSDKTRNYYHADGILKKVAPDEERDRWYFRVREMKEDHEVNVDPDLANKDAMTIFVNYRVFDYDQNYIGATGVGLTVGAVKELIQTYQEKYNRTIFFVGRDGAIKLAGPSFDKAVTHISQSEYARVFESASDAPPERSFTYKRNGHVVHANIRYIDEFEWYLVVEQTEQEAIKPIFMTLLVNLGICIVITTIVLVLIYLSVTAYQKRIETLRGIVPICSYCKQIRDDKGYWNIVEAYVAKYTDAKFSHSICPTCMEANFPKEYKAIQRKKGEK